MGTQALPHPTIGCRLLGDTMFPFTAGKMLLPLNNDQNSAQEHEEGAHKPDDEVFFVEDEAAVDDAEEDAQPFDGDHVGRFGEGNGESVADHVDEEQAARDKAVDRLV